MDGNQKFFAILWAIIGVCVVTLGITIAFYHYNKDVDMAREGYEQIRGVESSVPLWQKVECE